jgi:adenylylsulfate kinase-like enzyme
MKKILVMGLPGSGKTTLSTALAKAMNAVHFNADEIRTKINKDLTFDVADRIEHARRMGVLCDIVNRTGVYAIADFVCPTAAAREAFGAKDAYVILMARKPVRDFTDTTKLFTQPTDYHLKVDESHELDYWVHYIYNNLKSIQHEDYKI